MIKSYVDSNVFIFGLRRRGTNSFLVLESAAIGKFIPVVSYYTIEEVDNWFKSNVDRGEAFKARLFIEGLNSVQIINLESVKNILPLHKNKVPEDDLPHFCATKISNSDCLTSTNRHFLKEQKEILTKTPKEFVRDYLKLKTIYETDE